MNDLLREQIKRAPPQSQTEAVALAVRQSIAAFGPVADNQLRAAALGIARGLFGPAFDDASPQQKEDWITLAEREYRKALRH